MCKQLVKEAETPKTGAVKFRTLKLFRRGAVIGTVTAATRFVYDGPTYLGFEIGLAFQSAKDEYQQGQGQWRALRRLEGLSEPETAEPAKFHEWGIIRQGRSLAEYLRALVYAEYGHISTVAKSDFII